MHAVFHHACGGWLRDRIAATTPGGMTVLSVEQARGADLDRALAGAEVLLHVLHPVTEAMMDAAPRLKLIQKIGVGLDAIDLDAARARGIAVCNMPGTNTQAVVEMTLGLMLSVLRGLPMLDRGLRQGDWALPPATQGRFGEVAGKTVGLVGHGQVAQRLAVVLHALGAEVLIAARSGVTPAIGTWIDKAGLLARSDIVSLHIPETPETRHWLDTDAIAAMKPGAILVNTARGALVDQDALIAALSNGHLAGAGLDVFATEPLWPDDRILQAPNTVIAPHVAWLTRETLDRSLVAAFRNVALLREGAPLENRQA